MEQGSVTDADGEFEVFVWRDSLYSRRQTRPAGNSRGRHSAPGAAPARPCRGPRRAREHPRPLRPHGRRHRDPRDGLEPGARVMRPYQASASPSPRPLDYFSWGCGVFGPLAQPWCREGRRRRSPTATPVRDSPRTLPGPTGSASPGPEAPDADRESDTATEGRGVSPVDSPPPLRPRRTLGVPPGSPNRMPPRCRSPRPPSPDGRWALVGASESARSDVFSPALPIPAPTTPS